MDEKEIDYQNLLDRLSSFYGFKYSCERKYLGGWESELFKDYMRYETERPKMLIRSNNLLMDDYYTCVSGFGTTEQNSYSSLLRNVCGKEVVMFDRSGNNPKKLFNYGSIEEMIIDDMDLRGVQWPPK